MQKKPTKTSIFIGVILSLILLFQSGCSNSDYEKAKSLFNSGNYNEAIVAFQQLGDYEDSAEMVKECQYQLALQAINNHKYEEALNILTTIADYKDSEEIESSIKWDYVLASLISGVNIQKPLSIDGEMVVVEIKLFDENGTLLLMSTRDNSTSGITSRQNYYLRINKDDDTIDLQGDGTIEVGTSIGTPKASGSFSASSYQKGQTISWSTQTAAEIKLFGRVGTFNLNPPTEYVGAMLESLENHLSLNAPLASMSDLGFLNYSS